MVTWVPGYSSCTASARTCAASWRISSSASGSRRVTNITSASRSISVARSTILPSTFMASAARARPGPIAAATVVPVTGASKLAHGTVGQGDGGHERRLLLRAERCLWRRGGGRARPRRIAAARKKNSPRSARRTPRRIGWAPREACPRPRGHRLAFSAFSARSAVNPCRGFVPPGPPIGGTGLFQPATAPVPRSDARCERRSSDAGAARDLPAITRLPWAVPSVRLIGSPSGATVGR